MNILTRLKDQQIDDLATLSQLKTDVHEKAGELALKIDDCQEKNEDILKRYGEGSEKTIFKRVELIHICRSNCQMKILPKLF